ncbi:MAG: hypothetical protein AB7O38_08625 [Pirellulaceae bacterium]
MAWNGSGTFSRLYDWTTDRDAAIKILASRMDEEDDGFATGITACLAKNGENSATANLNLGGFKYTNASASISARTDLTPVGVVQDGGPSYAADSGAADAYVIALSPAITAYVTGMVIRFKATNLNTGSSTINVNGVGAKTIKKFNDQNLAAGDIEAGQIVELIYDGTNMQMLSPGGVTPVISGSAGVSVSAGNATLNITGLTAETALAVGDEIPIYDLSETANNKMTVQNFYNGISVLTAETSPATGDSFLIYDASETASNIMTFENYLKVINGLTADGSPDTAADYVVTYDASASAPKKVLLNLLGVVGPFSSTSLYTSTDQTITAAGSLTLAHNLSSTPKFIQISLVCQSANLNYSANDVVPISWGHGNAMNNNITCTLDGTNVNVRIGSGTNVMAIGNKTTGGSADIDITKWKLRFYAWY